jgi:hypothetical protein
MIGIAASLLIKDQVFYTAMMLQIGLEIGGLLQGLS